MKASEAYKTYHGLATGKVQPKPRYVRRSSRSKTEQEPKPFPGKRVKATAKVAKSGKKKQPTLGLETLSEIPWKSSDEDDDDEFTTHDDEARQEAEVNEEDSFDLRVCTPSRTESTDDKDNDDETQGANVKGKEMDEDATNIEGEGNELYRDVNVNLEGQDAKITYAH
ncbi:hypothetical protein Tco_0446064 [Tanacetum coccineum]